MEKEYHVSWEIDVYASSLEEAARKALAIHRDSESIATVFYVGDEFGETHRIDLTEIEDARGGGI